MKQPHSDKLERVIAAAAIAGIVAHLGLRFGTAFGRDAYSLSLHAQLAGAAGVYQGDFVYRFVLDQLPLIAVLIIGGIPLVINLAVKLIRCDWGADLLAGIAIVTAVLLQEYLAGSLIVLMLSGGEVLESYAVRRASSVLEALANRMPSVAHRKDNDHLADIQTSTTPPENSSWRPLTTGDLTRIGHFTPKNRLIMPGITIIYSWL